MRKRDREQAQKMYAMRLDGATFAEIGNAFGISRKAAQQAIAKMNCSRRVRRLPRELPDVIRTYMQENRITNLYEFAELIGMNYPWVCRTVGHGHISAMMARRIHYATGIPFNSLLNYEVLEAEKCSQDSQ